MKRTRPRAHPQRAITVVELSISLSVGLVILGLLYMLYDQVQREADLQSLQTQSLQEATLVADRIDQILSQSFDPAALGKDWMDENPELFAQDQLSVYSAFKMSPASSNWLQYIIANQSTDSGDTQTIVWGVRDTQADDADIQQNPMGSNADLLNSTIKFSFADKIDENLEPAIQAEFIRLKSVTMDAEGDMTSEAGQRPTYIRYQISVRDKKEMMPRPLTITSGVAIK